MLMLVEGILGFISRLLQWRTEDRGTVEELLSDSRLQVWLRVSRSKRNFIRAGRISAMNSHVGAVLDSMGSLLF